MAKSKKSFSADSFSQNRTEAAARICASNRFRRLPSLCAIIAIAVLPLAFAVAGEPGGGKSFFFETREACLGSGSFEKRECEDAFADAENQSSRHGRKMIGVQMTGSGNAIITAPMLAVAESAEAVRGQPIYRIYVRSSPARLAFGRPPIPSGRFAPSRSRTIGGAGQSEFGSNIFDFTRR